jgi:hypothetical protein
VINGKTFYQILGVLEDAEDIVIRAAYKSLSSKYHPDKWLDNKDISHRKMSEINRAYETLSDNKKRHEYDQELAKNSSGKKFEDDEEVDTSAEDSLAWELAAQFYPDINLYYKKLSVMNTSLANTYKMTLIQQKTFNNSKKVYEKLSDDYLTRYFGTNAEIKTLAEKLLVRKEFEVARMLNSIITTMGRSVNSTQVSDLLERKFPNVMNAVYGSSANVESKPRRLSRARIESGDISAYEAIDLIKKCGGSVTIDEGWLNRAYQVNWNNKNGIYGYAELLDFVRTEVLTFAEVNNKL